MAEGGGLLNRYTGQNLYRGFESLSLRHSRPVSAYCYPVRPLKFPIPKKHVLQPYHIILVIELGLMP